MEEKLPVWVCGTWCKFILNFRHCSSVEVGETCRSIIVVRNDTTAAKVGKTDVQYASHFAPIHPFFVNISEIFARSNPQTQILGKSRQKYPKIRRRPKKSWTINVTVPILRGGTLRCQMIRIDISLGAQ